MSVGLQSQTLRAVGVGVELVVVRTNRQIVARVAADVAIGVLLHGVHHREAVVADVGDAVAVDVGVGMDGSGRASCRRPSPSVSISPRASSVLNPWW
jgi:hypothetical protein